MPVSLERLIAEVEPNVITDALTARVHPAPQTDVRNQPLPAGLENGSARNIALRRCAPPSSTPASGSSDQGPRPVVGADPDTSADKLKRMRFSEVEALAFSFRSISVINNLNGLSLLSKLQLDNNQILVIANLGHLSSLTWLDLSFNKIAKIEGLDKLTRLVDLSLFNNQIAKIEGLDRLKELNVLSLGNNSLSAMDNVMYLRQFRQLRLVNLAGNPLCKGHDYRSYVLSHVKGLTYLDYRRVAAPEVSAAVEQHQDEMIEIGEREEQALGEERAAAERATHEALMKEANLDGAEALADVMVREDPEWQRLAQVPGLTDPWNDIRDKFNVATDEFKVAILDSHTRKKSEHREWLAAVRGLVEERDGAAKAALGSYEKLKKRTVRAMQDNAADVDVRSLVLGPKVRLMSLKDELLDIEMEAVEQLAALLQEFDRNYSEIADTNKGQYNAHFTQVRDLQNMFLNQVSTLAITLYEKYNQENSDLDGLPEEARQLLQDKDGLLNALQTSHDAHMAKIDGLEDRLTSTELRRANELTSGNVVWAHKRNRDRITEIINYVERNVVELDELAGEEEAGEG
ncbi:MAG: hypothetical protein WDW36_003530 [Sanguina aurantia]